MHSKERIYERSREAVERRYDLSKERRYEPYDKNPQFEKYEQTHKTLKHLEQYATAATKDNQGRQIFDQTLQEPKQKSFSQDEKKALTNTLQPEKSPNNLYD